MNKILASANTKPIPVATINQWLECKAFLERTFPHLELEHKEDPQTEMCSGLLFSGISTVINGLPHYQITIIFRELRQPRIVLISDKRIPQLSRYLRGIDPKAYTYPFNMFDLYQLEDVINAVLLEFER